MLARGTLRGSVVGDVREILPSKTQLALCHGKSIALNSEASSALATSTQKHLFAGWSSAAYEKTVRRSAFSLFWLVGSLWHVV
jgi:hypothetical protein